MGAEQQPKIWAIFNASGYRWGRETYASEQAARAELKSFFKGLSGVRLDRFYVVELDAADASLGFVPSFKHPVLGSGTPANNDPANPPADFDTAFAIIRDDTQARTFSDDTAVSA